MNKLEVAYTVKEIFFDCKMQTEYIAKYTALNGEQEYISNNFKNIALTGDEYDFFFHELKEAVNEVLQYILKYTNKHRATCNFAPHQKSNYHCENTDDNKQEYKPIIDAMQANQDQRDMHIDWDLQSTADYGITFTLYIEKNILTNAIQPFVQDLKTAIVQYIIFKWLSLVLPDKAPTALLYHNNAIKRAMDYIEYKDNNIINKTPFIF